MVPLTKLERFNWRDYYCRTYAVGTAENALIVYLKTVNIKMECNVVQIVCRICGGVVIKYCRSKHNTAGSIPGTILRLLPGRFLPHKIGMTENPDHQF